MICQHPSKRNQVWTLYLTDGFLLHCQVLPASLVASVQHTKTRCGGKNIFKSEKVFSLCFGCRLVSVYFVQISLVIPAAKKLKLILNFSCPHYLLKLCIQLLICEKQFSHEAKKIKSLKANKKCFHSFVFKVQSTIIIFFLLTESKHCGSCIFGILHVSSQVTTVSHSNYW